MRKIAVITLWVFVFAIPVELIVYVGGVGTISRLMGILAFGVGTVAVLRTGRMRSLHAFHVVMLLSVLWICMSFFWTLDAGTSLLRIRTILQVSLMVWLIWEIARTEETQVQLLQAYVVGTTVAAFFIIQAFLLQQNVGAFYQRFTAFGADPNRTALVLSLGLPMAWYLSLRDHRRSMVWLNRFYLVTGIIAILLTNSRSGLMAMSMGLLFIPLTFSRISMGKRVLYVVGGLTLILGVLAFIPREAIERLFTIQDVAATASAGNIEGTNIRILIWKSGLTVFQDHALLGVGAGAFAKSVAADFLLFDESRSAHNSYISILVEQGIVGFFLFLTMMGLLVRSAWKMPLTERKLFLILLLVWCISVMFIAQEYKKHTWFLFSILITYASNYTYHTKTIRERLRP